jgi:hypothetical protein
MERANLEATIQERSGKVVKEKMESEYERVDEMRKKIQMDGLSDLMLETKFSMFLYGQLREFEATTDKLSYFKGHGAGELETLIMQAVREKSKTGKFIAVIRSFQDKIIGAQDVILKDCKRVARF